MSVEPKQRCGDLTYRPTSERAFPTNLGMSPSKGFVTLGVQQTFARYAYHPKPLLTEELEMIQSGNATFFVYGFVEYIDTFKELHKVPFCVRYEVKSPRLNQCADANYHRI
jgi:hypothetical protein